MRKTTTKTWAGGGEGGGGREESMGSAENLGAMIQQTTLRRCSRLPMRRARANSRQATACDAITRPEPTLRATPTPPRASARGPRHPSSSAPARDTTPPTYSYRLSNDFPIFETSSCHDYARPHHPPRFASHSPRRTVLLIVISHVTRVYALRVSLRASVSEKSMIDWKKECGGILETATDEK